MMKLNVIITSGLLILSAGSQATTPSAWTVNKTQLLERPQHASATLSAIPANQIVTVLQRVKAWYQVKTQQGGEGWVKLLSLRFEEPPAKSGSALVSMWKNISNSATNTTVATGVRGFDEEDLNKATPNPAAVAQLDSYQISATQAQNFAKQGALTSQPAAEQQEQSE